MNTHKQVLILTAMVSFLVGGFCGYQFHLYRLNSQFSSFLDDAQKSIVDSKKEQDRFFDFGRDDQKTSGKKS